MTTLCENCRRNCWGRFILTCACGKTFCSQECLEEWHRLDTKDEKMCEVKNENQISKM